MLLNVSKKHATPEVIGSGAIQTLECPRGGNIIEETPR
jgi:hypothetical protein